MRNWWQHRSSPVKVALVFASIGLFLALVGVVRGIVPLKPASIILALVLSAGSWGLVSWAVATAAVDVETEDLGEESSQ